MLEVYPDAEWAQGPLWKTYLAFNNVRGVVLHSAEGTNLVGELNSDTNHSWHFSVYRDGRVQQHYVMSTVTWHAGPANFDMVGIEHEGFAGEPLTTKQLAASIKLVKWIGEQAGWKPSTDTLHAHSEYMSTACPSGRIPWENYWTVMSPTINKFVLAIKMFTRTVQIEPLPVEDAAARYILRIGVSDLEAPEQ